MFKVHSHWAKAKNPFDVGSIFFWSFSLSFPELLGVNESIHFGNILSFLLYTTSLFSWCDMDRTINAGKETHHCVQPSCDDSRREIWSPSRTAGTVRGHSDEHVLHDVSSGCCLWMLCCIHHRRFSLQLKNKEIIWYLTKLINNHCKGNLSVGDIRDIWLYL